MQLYRIGNTVLNLERIDGILDHHVPAGPDTPDRHTVLRIVFDHAVIDLADKEAQIFRRWYRHASLNLAPHRDEDGEELVWPEDQVTRALESLINLISRERPRNVALRHAAHRLKSLVELYITGELQPARASVFDESESSAPAGP